MSAETLRALVTHNPKFCRTGVKQHLKGPIFDF